MGDSKGTLKEGSAKVLTTESGKGRNPQVRTENSDKKSTNKRNRIGTGSKEEECKG